MAEVSINTRIEMANAAVGLKDLRKGLKDLVSAQQEVGAGSKEFKKLQDAINQTESKLGDLTDSFNTLKGSGVERLSASLGVLKDGLLTADTGKLKIGMEGLGAAMKAIPIFLLIEGLTFLANNFEEVVKVVKSVIGVVDEEVKAQKKLNEELQETNFQLKELDSTYKYYSKNRQQSLELEIEKLKQRGATQSEIDAAIIKSEQDKLNKLIDIRDKATELGVTDLHKYQNAVFEQQDAVQLKIAETHTASVERAREAAKEIEKIRQDSEKRNQDAIKKGQEIIEQGNREVDERIAKENKEKIDEQIKIAQDFKNKNLEFDKDEAKTRREETDRLNNYLKESKEKDLADAKKLAQQKQDAEIQGAQLTINAVQSISDFAFQLRSNNIKKGSAEELKAAKNQFNINKALQIAQATIQGIQAVQAAFSSGSAIPVVGAVTGPAFALAAGIASAANIAKIAAIKFDPGTGADSGSSASSFSTSSPSQAPSFQSRAPNSSFNPTGERTSSSTQNSTQPIKVVVLASDITEAQDQIVFLETRSIFK